MTLRTENGNQDDQKAKGQKKKKKVKGTELDPIEKVKIRDIHFAYNNHRVINLLQ
jgi:hypothetical protein